jgi:hypothetical protein
LQRELENVIFLRRRGRREKKCRCRDGCRE